MNNLYKFMFTSVPNLCTGGATFFARTIDVYGADRVAHDAEKNKNYKRIIIIIIFHFQTKLTKQDSYAALSYTQLPIPMITCTHGDVHACSQ